MGPEHGMAEKMEKNPDTCSNAKPTTPGGKKIKVHSITTLCFQRFNKETYLTQNPFCNQKMELAWNLFSVSRVVSRKFHVTVTTRAQAEPVWQYHPRGNGCGNALKEMQVSKSGMLYYKLKTPQMVLKFLPFLGKTQMIFMTNLDEKMLGMESLEFRTVLAGVYLD